VEIGCRVYRPRRARLSPLLAAHIEELFRVWPERFAKRHGPLRPVVERVLRAFLTKWDATLRMRLFRERLLARLLDKHAISRELVDKTQALEALTRYMMRPPSAWLA
jgi:hypothetical protein